MISGAAQQHKKRLVPLKKTDAMHHAERCNGKILDQIWKEGGDVFQVRMHQFHTCSQIFNLFYIQKL